MENIISGLAWFLVGMAWVLMFVSIALLYVPHIWLVGAVVSYSALVVAVMLLLCHWYLRRKRHDKALTTGMGITTII